MLGGQPGDRLAEPDGRDRTDESVDLGVDRSGHLRVGMAECRHGDPVREVEVGLAGRVVQAVADAMAPGPLEVPAQHGREAFGRRRGGRTAVRGGVSKGVRCHRGQGS